MPFQQWLADVARSAGLAVVEVDGWRERGNPALNPGGVCEHHTAGGRNGDIPSLRVLIEGRSDLPGPLCNYGIARSGTIYVIAAGRANHAGAGGWQGMVGNSSVVGVEYENAGGTGDPWPQVQLDAGARLSAAVMTHLGRETLFICDHKEWAPSRKVDRHSITGNQWRQRVQQLMDGGDEGKGDNVIYEFLTPDEPERFIGIARAGEVVLFADFGDSSVRLATGVAGDFVVETITVPHGKHVRRTIRSASGGPAHGISVRLEAGQRCGVTVYQ